VSGHGRCCHGHQPGWLSQWGIKRADVAQTFCGLQQQLPDGARTEPHGCGVAAVVLGMDVPAMAGALACAS